MSGLLQKYDFIFQLSRFRRLRSLLNLITNNVSGVLNEEDVGGRQSKTGGENNYKINHRSEGRHTRKK